jgi:hypothetical protein
VEENGSPMTYFLQICLSAVILTAVSVLAHRSPRLGALLLTLPIVSILAFIMIWYRQGDFATISRLAKETLILVPLGLPFFVPLAFAEKLHLSFWTAMVAGIAAAAVTIGIYFSVAPKT